MSTFKSTCLRRRRANTFIMAWLAVTTSWSLPMGNLQDPRKSMVATWDWCEPSRLDRWTASGYKGLGIVPEANSLEPLRDSVAVKAPCPRDDVAASPLLFVVTAWALRTACQHASQVWHYAAVAVSDAPPNRRKVGQENGGLMLQSMKRALASACHRRRCVGIASLRSNE